jgi:hypothetical protein
VDIDRVNRLLRASGDPLWDDVSAGKTPRGWVWHHVQGGQRMMLIPRDLHEAISHAGIATAR